MADGSFGTSISCMDGRIQIPLSNWIKKNYSVDYVDTITEPGVDKKIAAGLELESIKAKVGISVNAHKSKLIVVSGHYDCAANPVSDDEHITLIYTVLTKTAIKSISFYKCKRGQMLFKL